MTGEDEIIHAAANLLRYWRPLSIRRNLNALRLAFWQAGRCESCGKPTDEPPGLICRSCGEAIVNRLEEQQTAKLDQDLDEAEAIAFGNLSPGGIAERTIEAAKENTLLGSTVPIPMILWCPECGARHVDKGEFSTKPHHTHACQSCGVCWRPAVVHTVGVQFLPGFKDP